VQDEDETATALVVEHQGVRIDRRRHRAFAGNRELVLTPREFRLLELFLREPGHVFSRRELMEAIRVRKSAQVRSIDRHVRSLRRKLSLAGRIEAVARVGFRFCGTQLATTSPAEEEPTGGGSEKRGPECGPHQRCVHFGALGADFG
jgi:DNA-binding response OmpR family regulator